MWNKSKTKIHHIWIPEVQKINSSRTRSPIISTHPPLYRGGCTLIVQALHIVEPILRKTTLTTFYQTESIFPAEEQLTVSYVGDSVMTQTGPNMEMVASERGMRSTLVEKNKTRMYNRTIPSHSTRASYCSNTTHATLRQV